jgi:hypothetical protein
MMALMPVIDRYGPAIEWDLLEMWRVDIHDYFRGERPWGQLVRFLNQCPPSSRFVIAKRNDPEVALDAARAHREAQRTSATALRWRPPAVEWNTGTELTAAILDRLGEIEALLADMPIAGKKRKAKPPKRTPRPQTALEQAEKLLAEQHVAEIIADVESAYVTEAEYAVIAEEARQAQAAAQAHHAQTVQSGEQRSPSI